MRLWLCCTLLTGAVFFSCGTEEPAVGTSGESLAQVGAELITKRDFEAFVAGLPEWTKSKAEGGALVRDYLQSLVDRVLILHEARARGLAQSEAVKKNMAIVLGQKMGQEIERRHILPRISLSEEDLKREFSEHNWGRQLKIAHILLRTQSQAEKAMAALEAGQPFEAVAHEFSQNRTSAAHGGEKPYFYSRINATQAVREPLFSLRKGETSKIIPIPKGYEIFKILDERTAPYVEMRPLIYKELRQERLKVARRTYIDSLARRFKWDVVPEGMDLLWAILRSGKQEGNKKVFLLSNADSETPLYSYKGGQVPLGEAVARSQFIRQGRYVDDSLKVVSYLERDVKAPRLLLLQARELGIDQEPAIVAWLEKKEEEVLIREMRRLATAHIEPLTELELRNYYEANPQKYKTSTMVEVVEIQVEEERQARELLRQIRTDLARAGPLLALLAEIGQKLAAGQPVEDAVEALQELTGDLAVYAWLGQRLASPLEAAKVIEEVAKAASPELLAESYIMRQLATVRSVRHGGREVGGLYQFYWHETPRFGPLVKAAMEADVGAFIGPIEYHSLYSIAKVLGHTAAGRRPFEAVKKSIEFTVRRTRENQLFERWLEALRAGARDEVVFFDENIEALGRQFRQGAL